MLGAAAGGPPPNIFPTLARHRSLFRRWLLFAGALMPRGRLPRTDTELVILRVAHNCGSAYEWEQHERLARRAGLSVEDVARVRVGTNAPGWSPRASALLRATDELHATRTISSGLWSELTAHLRDVELIELCMLVGHYEMLAMTLNALAVAPDDAPARPSRTAALLQRIATRRRDRAGSPRS